MKVYHLRFFNLLFFLFITCTSVFAQPIPTTTIIRGGGHEDPVQFVVNNCEEGLVFEIYVANLELLNDEELPAGEEVYYPLPEYAPTIHLEISLGDLHYSITPILLYQFSHIQDGVSLYKASVTVNVSVPSEPVGFYTRLLKVYEAGDSGDPGPSGYSVYPMGDYRTPGDIFPCNIEGWTNCGCGSQATGCQIDPFYPGIIICDTNDILTPGLVQQTNTPVAQAQRDLAAIGNNLEEAIITPNPFDENLRIQYSTEESGMLNIELLDISGKRMLYWEAGILKGLNDINLSVDDLATGIYIIKLSDGHQNFTQKLIKS